MLKIIQHRVNQLSELCQLGQGLGAEVDLRTHQGQIRLFHDRGATGPLLESFLDLWASQLAKRGTLVLNVKEDGLESEAERLLDARGIRDFFFLDCAAPTLIRRTRDKHFAPYSTRYSEFETLDNALALSGRVQWVWVDSFTGQLPDISAVRRLRANFEVCLVSPELQGYPLEKLSEFTQLLTTVSAVCTKHPALWKHYAKAQARDCTSVLQRSAELA